MRGKHRRPRRDIGEYTDHFFLLVASAMTAWFGIFIIFGLWG